MIDRVGSRANGRFPFTSFPRGWFFFELASNLPTGRLVSRQWMGESVVGWRGEDGNVCIANAFCPHLGAKLAPETGGSVRNGNLVCPFHGFTYDTSGACVATPLAEPNPACRLRVYPSEEINGFVFGYFDERGREPESPLTKDSLLYRFTVHDPNRTAPYTGEMPWPKTESKMYEYACHEGNYSMFNTLRGARAQERAALALEDESSDAD